MGLLMASLIWQIALGIVLGTILLFIGYCLVLLLVGLCMWVFEWISDCFDQREDSTTPDFGESLPHYTRGTGGILANYSIRDDRLPRWADLAIRITMMLVITLFSVAVLRFEWLISLIDFLAEGFLII